MKFEARSQLSRLIGATTVVTAATKRSGLTAAEKKLKQLAELLEKPLGKS